MSTIYLFHEPGSVPGVAGLFSGVRVEVENDGSFTVSPLPYHPHAELAPVEEEAPALAEEEQTQPKSKKQAKAVAIEEGA